MFKYIYYIVSLHGDIASDSVFLDTRQERRSNYFERPFLYKPYIILMVIELVRAEFPKHVLANQCQFIVGR